MNFSKSACIVRKDFIYPSFFSSDDFVVLLLIFPGSVVEVTMCAMINLTRIILLFLVAPYYNWNTTVSGMYVHFNQIHCLIVYCIIYILHLQYISNRIVYKCIILLSALGICDKPTDLGSKKEFLYSLPENSTVIKGCYVDYLIS